MITENSCIIDNTLFLKEVMDAEVQIVYYLHNFDKNTLNTKYNICPMCVCEINKYLCFPRILKKEKKFRIRSQNFYTIPKKITWNRKMKGFYILG